MPEDAPDRVAALIRRNRLLVAEAAALCAYLRQRQSELSAQQGAYQVLQKHARDAASAAAEQRMISQHLGGRGCTPAQPADDAIMSLVVSIRKNRPVIGKSPRARLRRRDL
jgi:hypothetical protein